MIELWFGCVTVITLNNKINRVHEPALRIILNDHRSSFKSLLVEDHSFNIDKKSLEYLAVEAFKVKMDFLLIMKERT